MKSISKATLAATFVPWILAGAAIAACTVRGGDGSDSAESAADREGRARIGVAAEYEVPAGQDPAALASTLSANMKARRKFAWDVARRAFNPKAIDLGADDAGNPRTAAFPIPAWLTWYEMAEIKDIFDDIVQTRTAGAPPGAPPEITTDEVTAAFARHAARMAGSRTTRSPEMFDRPLIEAPLDTQARVNHLGGTGFTLFSPEYVRHALTNYRAIANCKVGEGGLPGVLTSPAFDPAVHGTNFSSPCLASEFPPGAVMAKAVWRQLSKRGGKTKALPVFDTGVTGVTKIFQALDTAWDVAEAGTRTPEDADIVVQDDSAGNKWGLVAFHLSTKETREWVWSTYWWAPTDPSIGPNTDFGADRDVSQIASDGLRGQLSHYKMCTVVNFEEKDDLEQRYAAELADPTHPQHSLAEALLATHRLVNQAPGGRADLQSTAGPSTWCSDPYVETHPGNTHTNCIGCHQHSATGVGFNETFYLSDEAGWKYFPRYGTTRIRNTFPSDFSWGYEFELKPTLSDVLSAHGVQP